MNDEAQREFREVQTLFRLPSVGLVEKDVHVVRAIGAVMSVDAAPFTLVFGGGTALARAHKLVRRMSEDVDFKIVPLHLLGRDIPVLPDADGNLRAEDDGMPASAKSVASYIARAFGDRLGEARTAMGRLAATLPPEELNRVGFRLYERFRPDVPEGAQGWGAKGELHVELIHGAAR